MTAPVLVDAKGLRYGVVGCEECWNETPCTGPCEPNNCPYCGAELWENDLPAPLAAFVENL